ncbi:MAG: flagellar motor protein MotB, partial [Ideonella sp.]
MTSHPTLRLLGLASVGALSALTALPGAAQSFADPDYFYGGLTVGQSRAAIAEQRIIDSRMPIGVTGTLVSRDEKATGYRVFGGYQFNRYFGLEAGYFNLGKFGMKANTVPAGTLDGQVR